MTNKIQYTRLLFLIYYKIKDDYLIDCEYKTVLRKIQIHLYKQGHAEALFGITSISVAGIIILVD